jgi:hypothetical protein
MKSIKTAISIACFSLSFASAETITGVVTDAGDNSPLQGAKIAVDATHYTFSGADGRYSLDTEAPATGVRQAALPPRMYWDAEARQFRWAGAYGDVSVEVRNIRGNLVDQRSFKATQDGGGYSFASRTSGIHIVTLRSAAGSFRFRTYQIDGAVPLVKDDFVSTIESPALAKTSASYTLTFTALNYASQTKPGTGGGTADAALVGNPTGAFNNGLIELSFAKAGNAITAKYLATNQVFIKSATLSQTGGSAKYVGNVTENNLTGGMGVEINYTDGGRDRILVFPNSQFVYFKKWIGAKGGDKSIDKITQVSAVMGTPAAAGTLKGAGTDVKLTGTAQTSYGWLALADPGTRNGVVGGWVTNLISIGIVQGGTSGNDATLTGTSEFGQLNLAAGGVKEGDMFALGYFEDARLGLEAHAMDIQKAYAIKMRQNHVVFDTWLTVGGEGTEGTMSTYSKWINDNLRDYGFDVAQIDDGWQVSRRRFDDYNHGGSYPKGMKYTADVVKGNRMMAGLWFMPFAGTAGDSYFSSWYLKDKNGGVETSSWANTNLDVTLQPVKDYIKKVATTIYKDWGYEYYKVDGMFTGLGAHQNYINDTYKTDDFFFNSRPNNKYKTNVEAYRDAWQIIRDASPDAFIMGCTISQNMRTMTAGYGFMDSERIGPDGHDGWANIVDRGIIRANRRYFYNGRVFWVDPDPLFVSNGWGKTHNAWNGITGMLYEPADKYPSLNAGQIDILKRTMPYHGSINVRPADFFEHDNPGIWLLSDDKNGVRYDVIGIFNWSETAPFTGSYSMAKLGLDGTKQYVGFDFWANKFVAPWSGTFPYVIPGAGSRIVGVRPVSGNPMVLGTSRHVADPVYSVSEEKWSGSALTGTSKVVKGDDYELRIYAAKASGNWTAGTPTVDGGATISVAQTGAEVRVTIKSSSNQNVKWSVPFN